MNEVRTIIFSDDELKIAIEDYKARQGTHFPRGSICELAFTRDPITAVVSFPTGRGGSRSFTMSDKELLSAMVEFCVYTRVMMPKRSTKHVTIVEEEFALVIRVDGNRGTGVVPISPAASLSYANGRWTMQ